MIICLNNQSELCITISIGESQIVLPREEVYMHTCSFSRVPVEIKISISSQETGTFDETALCLNISTIILCDCSDSTNPTLIITKKRKKFQNYTQYQYLAIDSIGLKILDTKHVIDNLETTENITSHIQRHKGYNILHIIKKSLIDMLLDGLLLSALLAWIFTWKVALVALLAIFLIALIINSIKTKTSKSKYRILNWDKDIDQPDDIEYFITHIEKYCD